MVPECDAVLLADGKTHGGAVLQHAVGESVLAQEGLKEHTIR